MNLNSLDWIDSQKQQLTTLLIEWAAIPSSSDNLEGLNEMMASIEKQFSCLQGEMRRVSLPFRKVVSTSGDLTAIPHGQALHITKRPHAPLRILLAGHMDTVYSLDAPTPQIHLDQGILHGPGVADMKGGLLVMLTALQVLERDPNAYRIGWEIIINPDEEVGSIGSEPLFLEAAKRNHMALLFEPSFSDGALVSARKGSINFSVVVRGKAAHAGRDFASGRNAIAAMADFILKVNALNDVQKGITVNPGQIVGGGAVNIVPALAICRFNARASDSEAFNQLSQDLHFLADRYVKEGIQLSMSVETIRSPKKFDVKSQDLFERIQSCAEQEGVSLQLRESGGVCDGNILAAAGLPVIDTLGVIGGGLHTPEEYMEVDSLIKRSRLVARFLMQEAEKGNF